MKDTVCKQRFQSADGRDGVAAQSYSWPLLFACCPHLETRNVAAGQCKDQTGGPNHRGTVMFVL